MQFFAPIRQWLSFILKGQTNGAAFVVILDNAVNSPNAIFRAIVPVIINTLDRVFRAWTVAHILQKNSEIVPTGINPNTPFSVVLKRCVVGIVTAVPHINPHTKFWSAAQAVRKIQVSNLMATTLAPTACSIAAYEIVGRNFQLATTSTLAQPERFFLSLIAQIAEYRQLAINKACTIKKTKGLWVGLKFNVRICVSHLGSPITKLMRSIQIRVCSASLIIPKMVIV